MPLQAFNSRQPVALQFAAPGAALFWEGDDCETVFELRSGIVRSVTWSEEGDRQVIGFYFAGDQIGLPLTAQYRYTAEAITDVGYVTYPEAVWRNALAESCRINRRMLRAIGAEQAPMLWRGQLASRNCAIARVGAFLAKVVDRLPGDEHGFDFAIPQVDIADYLAMTPETVCRAFRRLRETGIIAMCAHDRLKVLNRQQLDFASRS